METKQIHTLVKLLKRMASPKGYKRPTATGPRRAFYRNLKILRDHGVKVAHERGTLVYRTDACWASTQLPFPVTLSMRDVGMLIATDDLGGPFPADVSEKLRRAWASVVAVAEAR